MKILFTASFAFVFFCLNHSFALEHEGYNILSHHAFVIGGEATIEDLTKKKV